MGYYSTILELENQGIVPQHFDKFYEQLKTTKQLPPKDIVPSNQYQPILDYLQQKKVLDKDNKVLEDGLKIFDAKKRLEGMLNSESLPKDIFADTNMGSNGGIAPCVDLGNDVGTGGIAPCRY